MRHITVRYFILLVASWLFLAGCANAQDKIAAPSKSASSESTQSESPESKRCLSLIGIRDMTVIDKSTLLFEMPGNKYYVNKLPRACNGLTGNNPIMYRTTSGSLCSLDIITVLDSLGGGYQRGPSCGLGVFTPITAAEAKQLKSKRRP